MYWFVAMNRLVPVGSFKGTKLTESRNVGVIGLLRDDKQFACIAPDRDTFTGETIAAVRHQVEAGRQGGTVSGYQWHLYRQ